MQEISGEGLTCILLEGEGLMTLVFCCCQKRRVYMYKQRKFSVARIKWWYFMVLVHTNNGTVANSILYINYLQDHWIKLKLYFLFRCIYSTAWKYQPISRVLAAGPPRVIDAIFPHSTSSLLGKAEDSIRPAAATFGRGITSVKKTREVWIAICFCFFATKRAWMLTLESPPFHPKEAFDKADHSCQLQDW